MQRLSLVNGIFMCAVNNTHLTVFTTLPRSRLRRTLHTYVVSAASGCVSWRALRVAQKIHTQEELEHCGRQQPQWKAIKLIFIGSPNVLYTYQQCVAERVKKWVSNEGKKEDAAFGDIEVSQQKTKWVVFSHKWKPQAHRGTMLLPTWCCCARTLALALARSPGHAYECIHRGIRRMPHKHSTIYRHPIIRNERFHVVAECEERIGGVVWSTHKCFGIFGLHMKRYKSAD